MFGVSPASAAVVARSARAWIETLSLMSNKVARCPSHALRVRGLKVARSARAWIETQVFALHNAGVKSHALRVRGLKLERLKKLEQKVASHALRVRGLKLF